MPTLSIGIPAYNEEANIGFIINDLLLQNFKGLKLDNIYINSDGSKDATVSIVKKIKNKHIILIDNKKRTGRAYRQNQIMKLTQSDVLVLVDADTQIKDKNFISKITGPIISKNADLTSVRVQELPATTFLEKTLDTSMKLKKYIFESINNGDNIYTCHGRARAFSKNLYKKIKFQDSVTEDAYSYLYSIKNNFKYKFVSNTQIYYQLPTNMHDHENQSVRFIKSKKYLSAKFGEDFVINAYRLPIGVTILNLAKFLINNPLELATYTLVFTLSNLKARTKKTKATWEMSTSSKKLRKVSV